METGLSKALILCDAEKAAAVFRDFLQKNGCRDVTTAKNAPEAKRKLLEFSYDTVLINAPLKFESAEEAAIDIAAKNESQVILFVKNEYREETAAKSAPFGILTVGKPIHADEFGAALSFAYLSQQRIKMVRAENQKLQKKLREVKVVAQAKLLLMQYQNLSEDEAHRAIEKQAMDERKSRAAVAREIIDRYE